MGIDERVSSFSLRVSFTLLSLAVMLMSCEQRVEGCLDFRALQVDVTADDPCTDCCTYPKLQLNFIPVRFAGGTVPSTLRSSDTLLLGADVAIAPELGFYLHDLFLIADDGERLALMDTFTVFSGNGDPNFVLERSLLRVTPFRQTSYELGTLLDSKTFVAVEAKLGLPDILKATDIDLQPAGSPLNRNTDSLLISSQGDEYLDMNFKYKQLNGNTNSIQLLDGQNEEVHWELPAPAIYEPSFNLIISLGMPADLLLQLDSGTVNGGVFVADFLEQAVVLETLLSRS